jgi:hypothetical protein
MAPQPAQSPQIDESTDLTARYDVFWIVGSRIAVDDFSMDPFQDENKLGLTFEDAKEYMKKLAKEHTEACDGAAWELDVHFVEDLRITVSDANSNTVGQVRGLAN